jgi:hypothetical protein
VRLRLECSQEMMQGSHHNSQTDLLNAGGGGSWRNSTSVGVIFDCREEDRRVTFSMDVLNNMRTRTKQHKQMTIEEKQNLNLPEL